jgi:hypothetical protein
MKTPPRKKRPADFNQRAYAVFQEAIGETPVEEPTDPPACEAPPPPKKNPHAVALGRLGGKKGGPARSKRLTAEQRSEIGRKAAKARWKGHGNAQE